MDAQRGGALSLTSLPVHQLLVVPGRQAAEIQTVLAGSLASWLHLHMQASVV